MAIDNKNVRLIGRANRNGPAAKNPSCICQSTLTIRNQHESKWLEIRQLSLATCCFATLPKHHSTVIRQLVPPFVCVCSKRDEPSHYWLMRCCVHCLRLLLVLLSLFLCVTAVPRLWQQIKRSSAVVTSDQMLSYRPSSNAKSLWAPKYLMLCMSHRARYTLCASFNFCVYT